MYKPALDALQQRILLIRGQKVMLDADLAALYGVSTKRLLEQVRRNASRFPDDFMFQLSEPEFKLLRSQIATLNILNRKYLPFCFTEQGVAMLSSVLRSERAVHVNIAIMRAFVHLREMIAGHAELRQRLDELEKKYDAQFKVVFDALRALMAPPGKPRKAIGFHAADGRVAYRAVSSPRKKRPQ
jgi:hypothetical protein